MQGIKNIIFDLGGVLLDLDYGKTKAAFVAIGYPSFDELFTQYKASPLFEEFETGRLPEQEFLEQIARLSTLPVTYEEIIHAWNAMMLDFRTGSLDQLVTLAAKYELYLLSNTNIIHYRRFLEIFTRDTGEKSLDVYFNMAWYSHKTGMRKPNRDIYEFVLEKGNMLPGETLFIDDTITNIKTAKELGIHTHLMLPNEKINQLALLNL